jgi:hypothetical protein
MQSQEAENYFSSRTEDEENPIIFKILVLRKNKEDLYYYFKIII